MTRYFWDPVEDNVIEEYDDNGDTIVEYTTEPEQFGNIISQHRGGATSVYHYDGQGNTTALTNETGAITDTYDYNAFGEITEQTGATENPYRYVGEKGYQYNEETGDYYVRARTYEPTIARWLSVDPLGFVGVASNPYDFLYRFTGRRIDGANLYSYGLNDPVSNSDPTGQICNAQTQIPFLDPSWFYGPDTGSRSGELYAIGNVTASVEGSGLCCKPCDEFSVQIKITITSWTAPC